MSLFEAVVSGIVQGVTEFLPISSSGHLVILHRLIGFTKPQIVFDIFLHLGTLAAIFIVFWSDILDIFTTKKKIGIFILIATVATVFFVFVFGKRIEPVFGNIKIVGAMLILTGIWLILGNFVRKHNLGSEIKVLTKIPFMEERNDWQDFALKSVEKSFRHLNTDTVKVLFLHAQEDFKLYLEAPEFFQRLTSVFSIESLGISVYDPETVEQTMAAFSGLAYQFPFNLLDRRFEKVPIPRGKRYARSIFLQGLLASDHINPDAPAPIKRLHDTIQTDCASLCLSPKNAAWTFVTASDFFDYFLIGVETLNQLKDVLQLEAVDLASVETLGKRWLEHISDDWLDPRKWN